ncbi:complement C1q tumor necrosis factor-related protein 3-like [Mytilus edulis]|uniref:complement C1q tumor necrosis factor-related protein 3-like n=1 Tax=Mytilus edulis TaxID=6550 RepID=UPI0039EE4A2C
MQSTLDQEKKRFNSWYDQLFENFKMNSNKKIQELIVNLQKGYEEMVEKRVDFSAYRTSSQPLSSGAKVVFYQVWTNVGNGYEPSTGVFTAPYVGLYHLTAVVASENNKSLFLKLYHNGNKTPGSWLTGDGCKTGSFDVVLNLQKGDRVYIFVGSGSNTIFSNPYAYVTFSGHIIA